MLAPSSFFFSSALNQGDHIAHDPNWDNSENARMLSRKDAGTRGINRDGPSSQANWDRSPLSL